MNKYWDASEWDEVDDPSPFDSDNYDVALNGQEEQQALLQLENEYDGYSQGGAVII